MKVVKLLSLGLVIILLTQAFTVFASDRVYDTKPCDAVKYTINVKVDAKRQRITGKLAAKIKNNTNSTIKKLCLRNYAASILGKKGKSVLSNAKIDKRKAAIKPKKDKSVLYISLGNKLLTSGKTCKVSLNFKTDIPKKDDRFGYHGKKGNYFINLSYCFPELAAYINGKWAEYPYLKNAESNFNRIKDYKITVNAPKYLKVISVGNEKQKGKTTKITAKKVRDIAIVLTDSLKLKSKKVNGVKINYYGHKNKHMKTYNKLQFETAVDIFKIYTKKFGNYPYKELDVVSDYVHGMEFSGLVMCGLPDFNSFKRIEKYANYYKSSIIVVHEIAHQWFYNLVGSNPYKEAWLDEGLADFCENYIYQFSNTKALKKIRKEDKRRGLYSLFENMKYDEFVMWQKTEYEQTIKKYKGKINLPYSKFNNYTDYSQVVYRNAAYFLNCLKETMGDEQFFNMLCDYCDTYAYKEATTRAFINKVYEYNNSKQVKNIVEKFISL